jgi:hypothetical protein
VRKPVNRNARNVVLEVHRRKIETKYVRNEVRAIKQNKTCVEEKKQPQKNLAY